MATVNRRKSAPAVGRGVKLFAAGFVVLMVALIIAANVSSPQAQDKQNAAGSEATANDADLLIARCGQPSSDDSSAYDNPRPPVPSRIIEYQDEGLRFMFIPGGNTQVGDPPPYAWKLFGIMDMSADDPDDPSEGRIVSVPEARLRMPCWSGK